MFGGQRRGGSVKGASGAFIEAQRRPLTGPERLCHKADEAGALERRRNLGTYRIASWAAAGLFSCGWSAL